MSYHIVYDKQFIKVGELYLPIVLSGDNNLYESFSERRVRNFNLIDRLKDSFLMGKEELFNSPLKLKEHLMESSPNRYEDKNFGYFAGIYINGNRKTTFGMYYGIFKTGIEKALTIEQIREYFSCSITFSTSSYNKGEEVFNKTATTSEEIIQINKEAIEFEKRTNNTVYCKANMGEDVPKGLRSWYFKKQRKVKQPLQKGDKYYKIEINGSSYQYVIKVTSRNLFYSSGGKHFRRESEAKRYLDKIKGRFTKVNFEIKEFIC